MLPPPCHWKDSDEGSFLHWNIGCIAYVKPQGQKWRTAITWQGVRHEGEAATREQGKRWVERWVSAQKGLPRRRG